MMTQQNKIINDDDKWIGNNRVYTIPVNGFGRPKSDDELLKGIDGKNLTVLQNTETREITKENEENWGETQNERFLQLYGPFAPAFDTYRFNMWLRSTVGEKIARDYMVKMRKYTLKKVAEVYIKSRTETDTKTPESPKRKRRVSFHPVVKRGVPVSEGGDYEHEELKEKEVVDRKEQDILFVFMFVVNDWAECRSINSPINLVHTMAVATSKRERSESKRGRPCIIHPTKKDMIDCCRTLMIKLNLGQNTKLVSKAGRMMVSCVQDAETCDIDDIRSLELYLSN